MERKEVIITTEGSCSGNPGPGGYAGVIRFGEHTKEIAGCVNNTTNNRMELMAVIQAVKALRLPCVVTVRTKSQYVCNGMASAKERCLNGWKTKTGAKMANCELWEELTEVGRAGSHKFKFEHVVSKDDDCKTAEKLAKDAMKAVA